MGPKVSQSVPIPDLEHQKAFSNKGYVDILLKQLRIYTMLLYFNILKLHETTIL